MTTRTLPLAPGQSMESFTSTEAKNAFGKVLGRALRGVVVSITRHDEVSGVTPWPSCVTVSTSASLRCKPQKRNLAFAPFSMRPLGRLARQR